MELSTKNISMHFIDDADDRMIDKRLVSAAPRLNDVIRLGGPGNESYYTVVLVVWVYDEPECPYERVNIGIKLIP